ncbi:MAG TPA: ornithine cyclodeaminase family protein [Terriglobales bacterium]|nr:ornithine cyclodeaminase family protein [Terriglobales bacterium]
MNPDTILFLSATDVNSLLTLDECIAAVEQAFRIHGQGEAIPPGVLGMHLPKGGFHIKAGALPPYFAAKLNANFPGNPGHGLPTIQGIIVLCNAENGVPLAFMDSRDITSLRTAAATAIAARHLARADSRIATICGCGTQGRVQLAAICSVLQLQAAFVFDQNSSRASNFARELGPQLHLETTAADNLADAVRRSDICVTCTTSEEPLFGPEIVGDGVFIAAVGADNPHKAEIHPALMARSKIVCDVIEQCATIGDLHHALDAGLVNRAKVHAELGEIVTGRKPGRESEDEIIIFDSTGMALQDGAAAALVYEKACSRGIGTALHLSNSSQ